MKKTLFLCCLMPILAAAASADVDTLWTRTYGGPANDGFRSACRTIDGGFIAAGYTYSRGAELVNVFLVKTDYAGDTLWTRAIGGDGRDYGCAVCEAPDSGFVVAGYTTSQGAGREDVYVVRTDVSGDVVWERTYGGAGSDEAAAICATGDGHFLIAGRTESFGAGGSDLYLLKLDAAGDTVWARVFGGGLADWGQGVCVTADGYYGVSGTTGSGVNTLRAYVLKVDTSGNAIWENPYNTTGQYDINWGMGIWAAQDSGFFVASYTLNAGRDPCDASVLSVDVLGTRRYFRKYFDYWFEYGYDICETADGGVLTCGTAKEPYSHTTDVFLLKRVQGPGWVWDQAIGGPGSDWGSSIEPLDPGDYMIAGQTNSFGAGGYDGWLVMARDEEARVPEAEEVGGCFRMEAPAPNPVLSRTQVIFTIPADSAVRLAIYDVRGREVAVLADGPLSAGDHHRFWDGADEAGRDAAPGIYYARLMAGDYSESRKIVLLR